MFRVLVTPKVLKSIRKLPESIQMKLANLIEDLRDSGPVQPKWPNYSRLAANRYHCHLSYKWVACWYSKKSTVEIEVYYVGSRENAKY
jgi:mRNA-degrading endonuclease RelE of RelBE toxin-antitoxin system